MEVIKIRKRELFTFYHSNFYKQLIHIPFTLNRLLSYMNNPYSNDDDYLFYYLIVDNQIVSYRTLLHDKLFNEKIVVWSSGSWTNEDFRKQGFSSILYNEIVKDYSDNLIIYTRSVESIHFYKKKKELYFYFDNQSRELHYSFDFLNRRKILKPFFYLLKKIKKESLGTCNQSLFQLSHLDEITNYFLIKSSINELFPLTIEKIKWIRTYPWLSIIEEETKQIFDFSFFDFSFKSNAYEMRENNEVSAFYFRNIRQNIYYLHYVYYKSEKEAKLIAESILSEFESNKIKSIIIRDQLVIKYISELYRPIINKPYKNFLFIDSSNKYLLTKRIQHGVGELIFT